jgi:hypothetical protein
VTANPFNTPDASWNRIDMRVVSRSLRVFELCVSDVFRMTNYDQVDLMECPNLEIMRVKSVSHIYPPNNPGIIYDIGITTLPDRVSDTTFDVYLRNLFHLLLDRTSGVDWVQIACRTKQRQFMDAMCAEFYRRLDESDFGAWDKETYGDEPSLPEKITLVYTGDVALHCM